MSNTVRFLRIALLLNVIFCVPLFLIRAQPYDDHDLRELLLPEDCPAPCLMGIRPGVTTVEEAVKILEGHEWVGEVNRTAGAIRWAWNSSQPIYFAMNEPGSLLFNDREIVTVVFISTVETIGDINILLTTPTAFETYLPVPDASGALRVAITIAYDTLVTSSGLLECPLNQIDLWKSPTRIGVYVNQEESLKYPVQWDSWNIQNSMKKMCQSG